MTHRDFNVLIPFSESGVNNSNDSEDLLPWIPDVEWTIDINDEIVEDQRSGDIAYPLWNSQKFGSELEADSDLKVYDLEDAHAITIDMPQALLDAGYKVYLFPYDLPASRTHLWLYKYAGSMSDFLSIHKNPTDATNQITQGNEQAIVEWDSDDWDSGEEHWLEIPGIQAGKNHFLVRARHPLLGGARVKMSLHAVVSKNIESEEQIVAGDLFRATFADNFWRLHSYWQSGTHNETVPIDGANTTSMLVRDAPALHSYYQHRDEKVKYHMVAMHGFNYGNVNQVIDHYNMSFKRYYRAGFRGNFIGIAWDSSEYQLTTKIPIYFDAQVENAFQLAPALATFIRNTVRDEWAGDAANIDLYSHSLGGLVMWETLRVHAKRYPNEELVRNALGVDIAVWSDAFKNEQSIQYTDNNPLSLALQKKYTWRSWFNPADSNIMGNALDGMYHHCYSSHDHALWHAMRVNDWLLRDQGAGALPALTALLEIDDIAGLLTFDEPFNPSVSLQASLDIRGDTLGVSPDVHLLLTGEVSNFLEDGPRTPIGSDVGSQASNSLAREIPAMLITDANGDIKDMTLHGVTITNEENYLYGHLNLPYGCVTSPAGTTKSYLGTSYGWPDTHHSAYREELFPAVWDWYEQLIPIPNPTIEEEACFLRGIDRHD